MESLLAREMNPSFAEMNHQDTVKGLEPPTTVPKER
jgi:hypothetical protein